MTSGRLPLPDASAPKAQRYMRALRRGLLSYWYATLEGEEAAAIEAATAAWYVNILDEAAFEHAHGDRYRDLRANDRLGQVVMGLELIRNCETHASVVFDGLLVETHVYGVPVSSGHQAMRSVFKWAKWDALPVTYREVSSSASPPQRRARAEAQHAYREAVQSRHVTETLLDAMAFFQSLDAQLIGPPPPPLRWAFTEVPDTDPDLEEPTTWYLARLLGLDAFEPFLPGLAYRTTERLTAQWPAADHYFKAKVKQVKKEPPAAAAREVQHVIRENGKVVGYSGFQPDPHGGSYWVERRGQVWQDVRKGYRYFVIHDGARGDGPPNSRSAHHSQTVVIYSKTFPHRQDLRWTLAVLEWPRRTLTSIWRCASTVRLVEVRRGPLLRASDHRIGSPRFTPSYGTYGVARPGERLDSTALGYRSLIRMR